MNKKSDDDDDDDGDIEQQTQQANVSLERASELAIFHFHPPRK